MAPNASQEAGLGIPSHYMILSYTQLTYTILYYALLYYIVLYVAMVEMTPNPFQEDGFGIPSRYIIIFFQEEWIWHPIPLYDTTLYSIDAYYTIICSAWRWHPIPFKKLDLASHLTVLYYVIFN